MGSRRAERGRGGPTGGRLTQYPFGRPLLCQGDGSPVSGDLADGHFHRVLGMHAKWRQIRGFHTLRHSFASNLAARGVDQRVIDALMGHQTEEMRRRYQHLFPKMKRQAVDDLLL